jgi:hypothetical protein
MFDMPSLLSGPHKRGRSRFTRLGHAFGLHQKQLALSEFKKWLAALRIGAPAQHPTTAFCSAGTVSPSLSIPNHKHVACHQVSTVHIKVPEIPTPVLPVTFFYCRLIGNSADTPSMFPCSGSVVQATIHPMPQFLRCPRNCFDVVDQKNSYMSRSALWTGPKRAAKGKLSKGFCTERM